MRNYYKDLDRETLIFLYNNIRAKIEYNKAKHRAHKSLEYELRLMQAVLISTKPAPRYNWQDRRDLQ